MDEKFQLRNVYNKKLVTGLAERIKTVYPGFKDQDFCKSILKNLDSLSFGDRSKLIRENLKKFLPTDFEKSGNILIKSLGPELPAEFSVTIWEGFYIVPLSEYIAEMGIEHFDLSMNALYEMTKRFSSEGAIRAFIRKYPQKSLGQLRKWTTDSNVHVRRLVSEGARPRLPLCAPLEQFKKDPRSIIELLDLLKDDRDLYVRRSVSNNLNDISKDNPEMLIQLLDKWKMNATKERLWVIRHALRTLFKKGNKNALALLGYGKPDIDDVQLSLLTNIVPTKGTLEFSTKFLSKKRQKLMIDYRIHYMKANGKQAAKTFKLSIQNARPDEVILLKGKQSFKPMTTRKHYAGKHFIEIMINGSLFEKKEFQYIK